MEAQPGYEVNTLTRSPVKLLEILRDVAQSFDATINETMAIVKSNMKLMMGMQGKTASVDEFSTLFRSRVDTMALRNEVWRRAGRVRYQIILRLSD